MHQLSAPASRARRPRLSWLRTLPSLGRPIIATMPWIALTTGCLAGTAFLLILAHVAGTSGQPLGQGAVRFAVLPAIAALAFVPPLPFRPLSQATPVPAWVVPAAHVLLAAAVLAVTCWTQLRIVAHTFPRGAAGYLPPVYPLLAQLTGWCAVAVAAAACVDRSRYADLGGAIAAPAGFAAIAFAWYGPAGRFLAAPPATARAVTIAWYVITAVALALSGFAMRDRWHRAAAGRSGAQTGQTVPLSGKRYRTDI